MRITKLRSSAILIVEGINFPTSNPTGMAHTQDLGYVIPNGIVTLFSDYLYSSNIVYAAVVYQNQDSQDLRIMRLKKRIILVIL